MSEDSEADGPVVWPRHLRCQECGWSDISYTEAMMRAQLRSDERRKHYRGRDPEKGECPGELVDAGPYPFKKP